MSDRVRTWKINLDTDITTTSILLQDNWLKNNYNNNTLCVLAIPTTDIETPSEENFVAIVRGLAFNTTNYGRAGFGCFVRATGAGGIGGSTKTLNDADLSGGGGYMYLTANGELGMRAGIDSSDYLRFMPKGEWLITAFILE